MKQHILLQYKTAIEVHVLFDDPDSQQLSPKYFERLHQDEPNLVPSDHSCTEFSSDLIIPPKWREKVINRKSVKEGVLNRVLQTGHKCNILSLEGIYFPKSDKEECVVVVEVKWSDEQLKFLLLHPEN